MSSVFIGIDVSKDWLDVAVYPEGQTAVQRFPNTPEGVKALTTFASALNPERIILASTGLPAVIVNARQVRDFAKSQGRLAKTDSIDATTIAYFGSVVATTLKPLPSEEIQEFQRILDHRNQLVLMAAIEKKSSTCLS